MPVRTEGVSESPWLAILDGRFLPVDRLDLTIETDTEQVHGVGNAAPTGIVQKSQKAKGRIETRRNPCIKAKPKTLFLRNADQQIVLEDLWIEGGADSTFGTAYTIEFDAMTFSSESFL